MRKWLTRISYEHQVQGTILILIEGGIPMKTKNDFSYYQILNVDKSASQDEIKKAHRQCVKHYHPDSNKAPNAAVMFQLVQEAYEVLSDVGKRKIYDNSISPSSAKQPEPRPGPKPPPRPEPKPPPSPEPRSTPPPPKSESTSSKKTSSEKTESSTKAEHTAHSENHSKKNDEQKTPNKPQWLRTEGLSKDLFIMPLRIICIIIGYGSYAILRVFTVVLALIYTNAVVYVARALVRGFIYIMGTAFILLGIFNGIPAIIVIGAIIYLLQFLLHPTAFKLLVEKGLNPLASKFHLLGLRGRHGTLGKYLKNNKSV